MGTWNTGPFDNDEARELLIKFQNTLDFSLIRMAFADILGHIDDYIEAPIAQRGIAAAALFVDIPTNYSFMPRLSELRADAKAAIIRILNPPSELLELWGEASDANTWRSEMEALTSRVDSLVCE